MKLEMTCEPFFRRRYPVGTAAVKQAEYEPRPDSKTVNNDNLSFDSDAELARRVAAGDERAFEQLVARYQNSVFNTIYRFLGNLAEADDIAQEVFLILWNKAGTFKGNSKLSTWLYRIAANECLQYRRRRKTTLVSLDEIDENSLPDALQTTDDRGLRERREAVKRALAELPERQRMALVLAQHERRSYKEIAEAMDASVSSVESLLFRARETLKGKLTS
jgi:RNA polymerase sigma-70 factor (ECF subfamily)